jgi:hypothetical protein
MWFRGLFLTCVFSLVAVSAQAGLPSAKAWETFKEESLSRYGDSDPVDFEDQLYAASQNQTSEGDAIADFARRMGIDPVAASDYAGVIVDSVAYFQTCENRCPFRPGVPLYDEVARIGMIDPSGQVLRSIGRQIRAEDEAQFLRLAWNHPAALSIFFNLYNYNEGSELLAAALLKLPDDVSGIPASLLKGSPYSGAPDEVSGLIPAILEATEARLNKTPATLTWRVQLAQFALEQQLWMGLDHDAVARYLAYPNDVREALPYRTAGLNKADSCQQSTDGAAFSERLAAALYGEGRTQEAKAILLRAYGSTVKSDAVTDALFPQIEDKNLFTLYIEGEPRTETAKTEADTCDSSSGGLGGNGWIFSAGRETPAVRKVIADRLSAAGYRDMSEWLRHQKTYEASQSDPAILAQLMDLFPLDVTVRQALLTQRIMEAGNKVASSEAPGEVAHVNVSPAIRAWVEKPLPEGVTAWRETDKAPKWPKSLPVPEDSILRYEALGKEAAVVYQSGEYDLPGEMPAYGLWLDLKRQGVWQKPLYLGLQQYFPYVVTPGSRMPLVQDGHLQLEVQVKEIDADHIIFPPVNLRYIREAEGLYLDFALSDIGSDRDDDGLTDIEETRLGLKLDNQDSDGDGLRDGIDALPLTAYKPANNAREGVVAKMILTHFVGHDAGAIVITPRKPADKDDPLAGISGGTAPSARRHMLFLVSDIDIFSGIADAPFQLIIYSGNDLQRLGRDKIPFYPPQIINLFRSLDGNSYYVNWSASWVGGAFLIHCEGDTCTEKSLSEWIT